MDNLGNDVNPDWVNKGPASQKCKIRDPEVDECAHCAFESNYYGAVFRRQGGNVQNVVGFWAESQALDRLISEHNKAEMALAKASDGNDKSVNALRDREAAARLALLRSAPASRRAALRLVLYLIEGPWSGVSPEPWELDELAASLAPFGLD